MICLNAHDSIYIKYKKIKQISNKFLGNKFRDFAGQKQKLLPLKFIIHIYDHALLRRHYKKIYLPNRKNLFFHRSQKKTIKL